VSIQLEFGQKLYQCPGCGAQAIGQDGTVPGHLCGLERATEEEPAEFVEYVEVEAKRGPGRPRKVPE
jgi:uncharacterized Zn finger protein (UPF0148 family)